MADLRSKWWWKHVYYGWIVGTVVAPIVLITTRAVVK